MLISAGVVLDRVNQVGAHSPSTSTITSTTITTPVSTVTTAPATTTTTPYAPGVEVTAPSPGAASHCPLTMATSTAPPLRPRRCRVLEIGDSLGNDLGWGLERQLAGYPWLDLEQEDRSSSGLSNSWFFDWPSHLSADLDRYHPNIVIVLLGGNDQQSYYVHGVYEAVGTTAWQATYRHYVRQIVDLARAARAQVLWVGLPVMQPSFYSQGAAMLNSQFRAALRHVPGTAFVPTWNLFATPTGAFRPSARVNGVVQTLRSSDGIHFSEAGEDVLSTYVLTQMSALFHLPLRAAAPAVITS